MGTVLTAIFDGAVLRPDGPVNLKPHVRYRLTIEQENQPSETGDAWDFLDELTGKIEGPADWSVEHDHYLYGDSKRSTEAES